MNIIIRGTEVSMITIRVGSSYLQNGGKVINVKRFVQNPKFNVSIIDYDISLVELAEALTYTDDVQPIELVSSNAKDPNTLCLVSGWGNTKNPNESNNVLRAATVPIIEQDKCIKQYEVRNSIITPRMVCAGWTDGGKDSCQGKNYIYYYFDY